MKQKHQTDTDQRTVYIEHIIELFRLHGYDGLSLAKIGETLGMQKPSLYYHFPGGKLQMAEEALLHAAQKFESAILVPLSDQNLPYQKRVKIMISEFDRFMNGGEPCVFLALGGHEKLGPYIKDHMTNWVIHFAKFFESNGLKSSAAQEKAESIIILLLGSVMMAHSMNDNVFYKRSLKELEEKMKREAA